MTDANTYLTQVLQTNREIEESNPEVWHTFLAFVHQVCKDGALPAKFKEIILIALAVADHSPFCITLHTKLAIEAGASKAEIMEGALMAAAMAGGPGMAFMRYVLDACEEYGAE
ncbi:MAG: carboxymuconolactone decarboxylase family protein [Methanofollis sp.]|jgi:AhpD family alkylhydroperoxidase|uniref:carboxymuconolactone decarboxylase family protein n=1 Tax=unclassified Methanofollis TaxID=2634179 RepID=UPI002623823B|nr:carboxymuconolactone decarboxylase family protein [Methanofollis sp.]MDD4254748.1 carboxymuconolactone decarboxylase family protein [Methanofollis sp.]